jgi:hypothetical protein
LQADYYEEEESKVRAQRERELRVREEYERNVLQLSPEETTFEYDFEGKEETSQNQTSEES